MKVMKVENDVKNDIKDDNEVNVVEELDLDMESGKE